MSPMEPGTPRSERSAGVRPPITGGDPPHFDELSPEQFERLALALVREEENVRSAGLYNERRQRQFGVDVTAETRDGGKIVVSCKRYGTIRKGDLTLWSEEFVEHWQGHWRREDVRRFVLFVACEPRSRQRREEVEVQARRFGQFGVGYEVWGPGEIVRRLRAHRGIAAHFLGQDWARILCGSDPGAPGRGRFLNVPPRLNLFSGREAELAELVDALMPDGSAWGSGPPRRAALWGMGGLGKTSIASEFVHRHGPTFAGVLWCVASDRAALLAQLAECGADMGLPPGGSMEAVARRTVESIGGSADARWLVVYDNVEEPDAIRDLLPAGAASLLVTSRFPDWTGWARPIETVVWRRAESVGFLTARAARDAEGAEKLAEVLGELPLAMEHAAAICRRTGTTFAGFAAMAEHLIRTEPRNVPTEHRSVYATFRIAIDAVVTECPAVEEVMAFVSDCGPGRIPTDLLEAAFDDHPALGGALGALSDVSLLSRGRRPDGSRVIDVHRVVQMVGRQRAAETGAGLDVPARMIEAMQALRPMDAYSNAKSWPIWAALLPHLLHRLGSVPDQRGSHRALAGLCNEAGGYLFARGEYDRAGELRSRALDIRLSNFGAYDVDTSASLNDMGLFKFYGADFRAARKFMVCALRVRRRMLPRNDVQVIVTLNNLGLVYNGMGRHDRSVRLHRHCVAMLEADGAPDRPRLATALSTLAVAVRDAGDLREATDLTRRALDIRLREFGEDQPPTGFSLHNLGAVMLETGDLAGSATHFMRALRLRRRVLGSRHADTAWTVYFLGRLARRGNDHARAVRLCRRAYGITAAALGSDHPNSRRIAAELRDLTTGTA